MGVLAAAPAVGVAVLTPADAHAELDADDKKILAGYKTVLSRRACVRACVPCVRAWHGAAGRR